MKKAVVIGAGIIGLTTACRLAESGYAVTVIEKEAGPGLGTSKANAGQLLFDRIGAMGSPDFLRRLPRTLFDRDQGIAVYGLAQPSQWRWAGAFLGQCTSHAWQMNTQRLLEMAHLSRKSMTDFTNRHKIDFGWRKPGKLLVYKDASALAAAGKSAKFQEQFGGRHQLLSAFECIEHEPALKGTTRKITGGVFLPDAEVGDCYAFCQSLAQLLIHKLNGQIRYGVEMTGFERDKDRIIALRTKHEVIKGDVFILATGVNTPGLLPLKFTEKKPIAGVKGISLTFPLGTTPPDLSVTDAAGKFVVMRLGDQVRVAGYAIFSDTLTINPEFVQRLTTKARALMPEAADYHKPPDIWAGLRPHTPDDLPMIGRAGAENLYVNAGHGSLGWTLAFGAAEALLAHSL